MTSNSFYSNSCGNGQGGGFNIQTTTSPTTVSMTSCTLNYISAGTSGGMFSIAGTTASFTILNSGFYYTRAYNGHGGFVYLHNTGTTTMSITGSNWNYATAS